MVGIVAEILQGVIMVCMICWIAYLHKKVDKLEKGADDE